MDRRTLGYWIFTALFCVVLGISALGYLAQAEYFAKSIVALGYPTYVLTILGVAKLFGVIALLAPGRPLLKEWAYAGFAFDFLAASASHAFAGDPAVEAIRPLVILCVCALSYLLRPAGRRLPQAAVLGTVRSEPARAPSHG
jgi:hypothetical protein